MQKSALIKEAYRNIVSRGGFPSNLNIINAIEENYGVKVLGSQVTNTLGAQEMRMEDNRVIDLARELVRYCNGDAKKVRQVLNFVINTSEGENK